MADAAGSSSNETNTDVKKKAKSAGSKKLGLGR